MILEKLTLNKHYILFSSFENRWVKVTKLDKNWAQFGVERGGKQLQIQDITALLARSLQKVKYLFYTH